MLYKPRLAEKVLEALRAELDVPVPADGPVPAGNSAARRSVGFHLTCCHHPANLDSGTRIVNTCAGCDRRYRESEEDISTISLWETLADSKSFPFPDYRGAEMAVHDACPTRTETRVHDAIRKLLARMNIKAVEPARSRERAVCCGDSLWGKAPVADVKAAMARRAGEMPREDVAVYCVSCVKSMHIGGKRPRYVVDLLFGEPTDIGTFEPEAWHGELDRFIDTH